MNTLAIEDLITVTILTFMENLAELGYNEDDGDVDMWYRCLSDEDKRKISDKMLDIIERDIAT